MQAHQHGLLPGQRGKQVADSKEAADSNKPVQVGIISICAADADQGITTKSDTPAPPASVSAKPKK